MNKEKVLEIFQTMANTLEGIPVDESLEIVGSAVGLMALTFERAKGIDRQVTFKMVQRHAHAMIKEMERSEREDKKVD